MTKDIFVENLKGVNTRRERDRRLKRKELKFEALNIYPQEERELAVLKAKIARKAYHKFRREMGLLGAIPHLTLHYSDSGIDGTVRCWMSYRVHHHGLELSRSFDVNGESDIIFEANRLYGVMDAWWRP